VLVASSGSEDPLSTWAGVMETLGGQVVEVQPGPGGAGQVQGGQAGQTGGQAAAGPTDEAKEFVSVILADTEDTWTKLLPQEGYQYTDPKLVLFTDVVDSACGQTSASTGPFYCPGDQHVYLDLGFLAELRRLGATGDFAVAYVIAHEVGHHVQHIMGIDEEVQRLQARVSQADANALSVMTELQADCYAGVWANHANQDRQILEAGDVEEGLNAAASVGDDRLMRMSGRRVQREAFTHGSSKERVDWFQTGLKTGDLKSCDTFKAAGLR
jgi:predicted metalloprotease